ncbi:MAG TPA: aldo/keto reductase [Thermoleophilaceae bacterium]|nr:aldo/keto reductase [Thermoleophilaceae bacterium]
MRYTRLGQTDLDVSRVCFGTWQTGGDWGAVEEREAHAAARRALDLGVNFFDTAQAYGFGESERLLGRSLELDRPARRDEVVVATKGGLRMDGDTLVRDSSPAVLRDGIEQSLRELGTDHVDLYQVHWPDHDTPFEETAAALGDFVSEGKARYAGVSNFDVEEMEELARTRPPDSLQPPYHLFRRDIEEEILPYCRENGIGVLVYGPLAHGLLTGNVDTDTEFASDDWRGKSDMFRGEAFESNVQIVRELGRFAEERGQTLAQLAVAWALGGPGVDVAIVGARRPDHIEGTAAAADLELTAEDRRDVDEIMEGAVPVGGPSPEAV